MNDIVVATGWHSNGKSPNPGVSEKCYREDWLSMYWIEFNLSQIWPISTSLYISNCDVKPSCYDYFTNVSFASLANDYYHTRHDSWSSILSGAMYAYNNNLDLVYIEQDCFVWGLKKAIRWAQEQESVPWFYGYDPNLNTVNRTWAEYSFLYVAKDCTQHFIEMILSRKLDRITGKVPERLMHEVFGDYASCWPFGYGRMPVQDWNQDTFYKQQLTDADILKFMGKLKN